MGEVIVVVSGKGGVGKTTVTANIGAALAAKNKRVLLIDADMGLRNLDITLGVENKIVYDVADVIDEVCPLETALITSDKYRGLSFIPSPQTRSSACITDEKFADFCHRIAVDFDYVIVDGPAGIGAGFFRALRAADKAIVVTQPLMSAIRDADRTVCNLEKEGVNEIFILINSLRLDLINRGIMTDADYVLDILGTALLGIVPYDEKILEHASKGEFAIGDSTSEAAVAFSNIAGRLCGEKIPIMDIGKKKKRGFLFFKRQKG